MPPPVLFRTDASTEIGTGHMMRCLALGEALRDMGSTVVFLISTYTPSLKKRLTEEQMSILQLSAKHYGNDDAQETAEHARTIGAEWVVVDGYQFDSAYQKYIKDAGLKLLFIDDYRHCDHYEADIILNQNVYASENLYTSREPHSKLLLGTKYVLLRKEFYNALSPRLPAGALAKVGERVRVRGSRNILLTLGGFAPAELLHHIQKNLEAARCTVRVAEGGADMPSLMQWADIAVSAGGTTTYELAYMGVPSVLLVRAGNQTMVAEGMVKAGCAVNLGHVENVTTEEIALGVSAILSDTKRQQQMSRAGQCLVDGEGAERVALEITGTKLRIRDVRPGDTECIWTWANDRETRQASFSPKEIPWEDHIQWFAKRLADVDTLFFIGIDRDDTPVGYIRFEGKPNKATISIAVAPERRGQGYGNALLQQGCRQFFQQRKDAQISAYVKPTNAGSAALFQKTGFHELTPTNRDGSPALHFTLSRSML